MPGISAAKALPHKLQTGQAKSSTAPPPCRASDEIQ